MKKRLLKVLSFLPEGQGIYLDDDVFLTGMLDGSDKICGFCNRNGEYCVLTGSNSYPITDMDKEDLQYIFNLSSPNIFKRIQKSHYKIMDNEDI